MVIKSVAKNIIPNFQSTICPAVIEDTREISLILAKSFYDLPDFVSWIYPFIQFTINEDLRYRLRSHSPLYCCLVARLPNRPTFDYASASRIVGTVEVALQSPSIWSNSYQYPYISNLAVNPNYRRLGIASQLLTECEQIALDWGYEEIQLHVLDSNHSAKQLYLANGYQISKIEGGWGSFCLDYSPRLLLKKQII